MSLKCTVINQFHKPMHLLNEAYYFSQKHLILAVERGHLITC